MTIKKSSSNGYPDSWDNPQATAYAVEAAEEAYAASQTPAPAPIPEPQVGEKLFDITCTIGAVYRGQGTMSPRQTAFLIIADHGGDGEFHFPNEDGTETIVGVINKA